MNDFLEKLYQYLYINKCPKEVDLSEYTTEEGCPKGFREDLQVCRNCWQSAIVKLEENN